MRPRCDRAWEAEAIEDGRLAEIARLSFERHAIHCRTCVHERSQLASLRELGNRLPNPTCTPLEHKRLRASILREGYRQGPLERHPQRRVGAAVATLAVILAGEAVFSLKHWAFSKNSMLPAVYAVATPTFEAVPVGIAEWRVEHIDGAVRATLGDGRMAIHVTKLTHGQRFVVFLPDGELEVRGTRFFVEVREGRTRRVDVVEGTIALRLQSSRERSLAGGESFIQGPLESVPESSPEPRTAVPIPSPPAAPSRLRGTVKSGQPARLVSHDARASATELTSSAGVLFAEAMAVYGAGSFDRADSMFAEFHRRFPEDTRCEDADFLRVVSRHRMGDGEGAEERSRAYLTEHPGGLRRDEVEALLHRRGTP